MSEWIGVVQTTMPQYLKGYSDATVRNRLLLGLMQNRGRLTFNNGGVSLKWLVQKNEPPVEGYTEGEAVIYIRRDLYQQLELPWRGYIATDAMSEKERLMNKGDMALINRYAEIAPTLVKAISNRFGEELYINGNAAGFANRIHGLESIFGAATGGAAAGRRCAIPQTTYGGVSTEPGLEGTWSASLAAAARPCPQSGDSGASYFLPYDWPDGSGSANFDYVSPLLVNWSSTGWGTGATTFLANGELALRQAILWQTLRNGATTAPTVALMAGPLMAALKQALNNSRQIIVPVREAEDLGFPQTVNYEGVILHAEFGIPANTVYLLNVNEMELMSLGDELFMSKGPEWDPKTYSYLWSVGFFGNLRVINPKFQAKLFNYA